MDGVLEGHVEGIECASDCYADQCENAKSQCGRTADERGSREGERTRLDLTMPFSLKTLDGNAAEAGEIRQRLGRRAFVVEGCSSQRIQSNRVSLRDQTKDVQPVPENPKALDPQDVATSKDPRFRRTIVRKVFWPDVTG